MSDVIIIDSGGANLASLCFALERLSVTAKVSSDPEEIAAARRVILPGVGSAKDAMQRLKSRGIAELLPQLKQPVLGICLGMQLLFRDSEEGPAECLNILPDSIRRLTPSPGKPVPHMGWNQITKLKDDPLLEGIAPDDYVYFVHGYAAPVGATTLASTEYGETVSAVVRRDNFWGVQFHPERSAKPGARILANFLKVN